jgi:hypothetical protein
MEMKFISVILPMLTLAALFSAFGESAKSGPNTLLTQNRPFSRDMLQGSGLNSGFSLIDPARFSMSQSYSTSMSFGGGGSQAAGVYLNTLSYRLFQPLTFSVDLGIYTPFYSSQSATPATTNKQLQNVGSLIFPRMSLEYQPTKNLFFSLNYINMTDACKAYGLRRPFGYYLR